MDRYCLPVWDWKDSRKGWDIRKRIYVNALDRILTFLFHIGCLCCLIMDDFLLCFYWFSKKRLFLFLPVIYRLLPLSIQLYIDVCLLHSFPSTALKWKRGNEKETPKSIVWLLSIEEKPTKVCLYRFFPPVTLFFFSPSSSSFPNSQSLEKKRKPDSGNNLALAFAITCPPLISIGRRLVYLLCNISPPRNRLNQSLGPI